MPVTSNEWGVILLLELCEAAKTNEEERVHVQGEETLSSWFPSTRWLKSIWMNNRMRFGCEQVGFAATAWGRTRGESKRVLQFVGMLITCTWNANGCRIAIEPNALAADKSEAINAVILTQIHKTCWRRHSIRTGRSSSSVFVYQTQQTNGQLIVWRYVFFFFFFSLLYYSRTCVCVPQ